MIEHDPAARGTDAGIDSGVNPSHPLAPGAGSDLAALFSALAHDLRAALNGIIVWTHILERDGDESTLRAVEGIRRAVNQQSQLAMELSDFGRAIVAHGWPDGATTAQAIGEAVDRAGEGVPVEMRLAHGLPRVAMPAAAVQAIVRLVVKSLRAHADERARIVLDAQLEDDEVCLQFRLLMPDGAIVASSVSPDRRTLREALAALCADLFDGIALLDSDVITLRLRVD